MDSWGVQGIGRGQDLLKERREAGTAPPPDRGEAGTAPHQDGGEAGFAPPDGEEAGGIEPPLQMEERQQVQPIPTSMEQQ